jgi:hypothetical protein
VVKGDVIHGVVTLNLAFGTFPGTWSGPVPRSKLRCCSTHPVGAWGKLKTFKLKAAGGSTILEMQARTPGFRLRQRDVKTAEMDLNSSLCNATTSDLPSKRAPSLAQPGHWNKAPLQSEGIDQLAEESAARRAQRREAQVPVSPNGTEAWR